jgi:hypothetical protein
VTPPADGEEEIDVEPLAFTTDKISWAFISSAIHRIGTDEVRVPKVDLNLEAAPCIVLSCIAVEAFVNEVSSLTHAFLFEPDRDHGSCETLQEIASIRQDSRGSFYDRYKSLLCELDIQKPGFLADLSNLKKLRDALVHFRECDVPVIEDTSGVIRNGQDLPTDVVALQKHRYQGRPLVADDPGTAWTLRIATDAMAAWSVNLALDAVIYVLDRLPTGEHRDFLFRAYGPRDAAFPTVFAKGKRDLETWWRNVVQTTEPAST